MTELKNILDAKIDQYQNYYIFEPVGGLGEAYVAASLVHSFKEHYDGKVMFITSSNSKKNLLDTFEDIDVTLVVSEEEKTQLQDPLLNNKFIDINLYKDTEILSKNMIDRTKMLMRLQSKNAIYSKPKPSNKAKEDANKIFNELNLNDKTVFLSTKANSCNWTAIPESFWAKLANILIEKGYNVVFNAEDGFYKYKKVFLPIDQTIEFAKLCCHSISFRSGFSDILAGISKSNLTVIYPDNNQKFSIAFTNELLVQITKIFYEYDDSLGIVENFLNMDLINIVFAGKNLNQLTYDGKDTVLLEKCINLVTSL